MMSSFLDVQAAMGYPNRNMGQGVDGSFWSRKIELGAITIKVLFKFVWIEDIIQGCKKIVTRIKQIPGGPHRIEEGLRGNFPLWRH